MFPRGNSVQRAPLNREGLYKFLDLIHYNTIIIRINVLYEYIMYLYK